MYQAPSYFNLWRSKPWANSIDRHLNSSVKYATVFHSSLVTNGKHPSSSKNSQFASSASIWSHLKALLPPQTTRPDQPDIKIIIIIILPYLTNNCMWTALPITACGLRLDDEDVRIAVRLRLGAAICEPHIIMFLWSQNRRHRQPRLVKHSLLFSKNLPI